MPTQPTQALVRAFNYAIESCGAYTEAVTAIRHDYNSMLAQGMSEFAIIHTLHEAALSCVMARRLEKAVADGDALTAAAIKIILHQRHPAP